MRSLFRRINLKYLFLFLFFVLFIQMVVENTIIEEKESTLQYVGTSDNNKTLNIQPLPKKYAKCIENIEEFKCCSLPNNISIRILNVSGIGRTASVYHVRIHSKNQIDDDYLMKITYKRQTRLYWPTLPNTKTNKMNN